jgi:hypothetical protein
VDNQEKKVHPERWYEEVELAIGLEHWFNNNF